MHCRKIVISFFAIFFLIAHFSFPQKKKGIRDYLNDLNSAKYDTIKLEALNRLSQAYWKNNPDSAIYYANLLLKKSQDLKDLRYESFGFNDLGVSYFMISDFTKSLKYYLKSIELKEKNNDEIGVGSSCNNLGLVYYRLGDYKKALACYLKSAKICEKFKDYKKLGNSYNNIANVYIDVRNFKDAEAYLVKALFLKKKYSDSTSIASGYSNLGGFYRGQSREVKAQYYFNLAKDIYEQTNDYVDLAGVYTNLGYGYNNTKDFPNAKICFDKALVFALRLKDSSLICSINIDLAVYFVLTNNFTKAIDFGSQAYSYAKQTNALPLQKEALEILSRAYEKTGKMDKAFLNQKLLYSVKDSLVSSEKYKEFAAQELKYKYDKEQQALEIEQHKKELQHQTELKNKQKIISFGVLGSIVLVIFLVIIFRSLIITRKTKKEIVEQKHLVDEKNKEITDSINYANRLQQNILPDENEIISSFSDGFVIYKPKDIVSGDHIWFNKIKTAEENNFADLKVLIVLDCTGHGVPGAFMTMLVHTMLNQTTQIKSITQPAHVFNFLNKELIRNLNSKNSEQSINDGLEMALGAFDLENKKLYYACAGHTILLIRNNKVMELKGNRHSITANLLYQKEFQDFIFDIEKGDCFYFFTDGFPDQFGGPKQKKYKYKQLENKLLENHILPFSKQKEILLREFNNWRDDLEQVDDVTIVGIKV